MKHTSRFVTFLMLMLVAGCTLAFDHNIYNDGFDFPSENVKRITKGKTTTDDLIQLFGGPLSKSDVSEDEEIWGYSYSSGIRIVENGFFTDSVQDTHHRKALSIRIKNGTVVDYTYTESN